MEKIPKKWMKEIPKNWRWALVDCLFAGFGGIVALENMLEYTNTKSTIFQSELAKAPELTKEVYQSAMRISEDVSSGDLYRAVVSGALAGFFIGFATYNVLSKDKK